MKNNNEIKIEDAIQLFLNYLLCKKQSTSTLKAYSSDLRQFNSYIIENETCMYISHVSVSTISNYRKWLSDVKHFKLKTIYRKIDVISSLFNFLVDRKYVDCNLTKKLFSNKKRKKVLNCPLILTPDELEKLIQSVKMDVNTYNRDVAIITLLAYSGLKRSEAIALDWRNVDLVNDVFFVDRGSKEEIKIPIHAKTKDALVNLFSEHVPDTNSPVFQGLNYERIGTTTFNTAFTNAVLNSGIKKERKITSRSLQSYFIYWALKKGGNLIDVAHFKGHKDLNQLKVYEKLIVDEKKKHVIDKIF